MTVAKFLLEAKKFPFDERVELAHRLWDEFMDGFKDWKAPPMPAGSFPWKSLKLEIDTKLKRADRIKLAQQVWQNITENGYDPDPTPEEIAELERRIAEFEKNPAAGIPLEQVLADVRRRFRKSRRTRKGAPKT